MTVSAGNLATSWVNGLGDQRHCNDWAPIMKTSSTTQYSCFPVSRRDRQWGLYVTTVGHSRIPRGSEYPPKDHPGAGQLDHQRGRSLDEYQLVYISHGSGTLEMPQGKQWSIEAGDLFLLVPGAWHRYWPHSETGWNEQWVGFDGRIVRSAIMSIPVLTRGRCGKTICTCCRSCCSERSERPWCFNEPPRRCVRHRPQ